EPAGPPARQLAVELHAGLRRGTAEDDLRSGAAEQRGNLSPPRDPRAGRHPHQPDLSRRLLLATCLGTAGLRAGLPHPVRYRAGPSTRRLRLDADVAVLRQRQLARWRGLGAPPACLWRYGWA